MIPLRPVGTAIEPDREPCAMTSFTTSATKSGRPSVRSCSARTNVSSGARAGTRAATYCATSCSENGIEHDLLGEPVQAKLVAHRAERMVRRDDLREAEAREPEQPGAATRRRAT